MEEQFLYSHYSNTTLISMYMLIYVGLYVNKQSKKTGRENVHIETTLSPVLYTDGCIFDKSSVRFLTEVSEMSACLIES